MKKILHIFSHLNNAGTEKVIFNICNNIKNNDIKFNILVFENGNYEDAFNKIGVNIFKILEKDKRKRKKELLNFLKMNKYDIVHVHMSEFMYEAVRMAKKAKINRIILHSHNARQDLPKFAIWYKIYREIFFIDRYVTDYFSCSVEAAKWLFPLKYKKTKIINNGINMDTFKFRDDIRRKVREKLGLSSNDFMVISVGRLVEQKNMEKIIDIAKNQENPHIKFFIVGDGDKREQIQTKINTLDLNDKVFLLGNQENVNELLFAADVFLLTSKYEGLGIVLIEAQTSGLYVISSNKVPNETNMGLGLFSKVNLEEDNVVWNNEILKGLEYSYNCNREDAYELAIKSKYNAANSFKELENIYCEM